MGSALVRISKRRGTVGDNIRLGRESRGLTREDLALRLGCTEQDIRRMEKDRVEISRVTLKKFAFTLKFPMQFFYRPLLDGERRTERRIAHIQGDGVEQCSRCAYVAEYLCDFPAGNPAGKKTCDLKLCEKHAVTQSGDVHFCPQHAIIAGGFARQRLGS